MSSTPYDPKQFKFVYGGVLCPGGYGRDTFIVTEVTEDMVTMGVGMDGEAMPIISNNRSGTVSISLLPNAEYNAVLTAFLSAQRAGNRTSKQLQIEDFGGTLVVVGTNCFITREPGRSIDKDGKDIEWKIICGKLIEINSGGGAFALPFGVSF
jgi:hypothetical protein